MNNPDWIIYLQIVTYMQQYLCNKFNVVFNYNKWDPGVKIWSRKRQLSDSTRGCQDNECRDFLGHNRIRCLRALYNITNKMECKLPKILPWCILSFFGISSTHFFSNKRNECTKNPYFWTASLTELSWPLHAYSRFRAEASKMAIFITERIKDSHSKMTHKQQIKKHAGL
jgi:hypothetical protein